MKAKTLLSQLFENNRFLKIFAIVLAVLLYLVLAMTSNRPVDKTISNVPVNLDSQASNLANQQLNIIEGQDYTVDITVRGTRTVVGRLRSDSAELATTARVSDLNEAGEHTLSLISAYTGSTPDFSIINYSPSVIKVTLDRLKSKSIDIQPIANGVSSPPGYVTEPETSNPAKVNVTGPEAELAKIASAEISVELTSPLTETYSYSRPVILRDEEGNEIDSETHHLTLDIVESQLSIPVFKETTLPLEVDFLNQPRSFPEDELREYMYLSVDSTRIYGPESVIETLSERRLGFVDIKALSPDNSTFSFPLNLAELSTQIKSMENVTDVDVYFDTADWQTARFNIKDIEAIHVPAGYEASLAATTLSNVEFVGVGDVFETMTSDDIVGEVDLSDRELKPGQYPLPVKISVPAKGLVWALGDTHTVIVEITEKE